ncbi:hydroxyethylthiazole kinase [Vibrio sp.]|nr:hydroxyethylthiazole kinase [Vibrio sp.]
MDKHYIQEALIKVREQRPLIVNITNYVVMNNTANALLAIGASPIMAHSQEEMTEMMSFAGALVINIGTLDSVWIPRMLFAVEQANHFNKPVILDPVGCGATQLRTNLARQIASLANSLIIRGNASEIIAMAGQDSQTKGVDALDSSEAALSAAQALLEKYDANVVISGETDYVVSKNHVVALSNGSFLMPYVTGTGCSLSALTGAFAATGETTGLAAAAIMSIAGEIAAELSHGPGSLQMHLLDTLYTLTVDDIEKRLNLRQIS